MQQPEEFENIVIKSLPDGEVLRLKDIAEIQLDRLGYNFTNRVDGHKMCIRDSAMGNSQGGFKEYWDIIRKYPKYQGGFIWDFVDQSCHWKNKDGVNIYGYGGDFNKYDASDNNFNDNGLISPDRVPNPHAYEVAYFYQDI